MDEGGSIKRIFLPEERIHHPVVGCHMSENLFDSVCHVALNLLFPAPWQLNLKGWENLAKYLLDQNTGPVGYSDTLGQRKKCHCKQLSL